MPFIHYNYQYNVGCKNKLLTNLKKKKQNKEKRSIHSASALLYTTLCTYYTILYDESKKNLFKNG